MTQIKNLAQSMHDCRDSLLSYDELNEFSGQWMACWEMIHYPSDSPNEEVWHRTFKKVDDKTSLWIARSLGQSVYKGTSFKEAKKHFRPDF